MDLRGVISNSKAASSWCSVVSAARDVSIPGPSSWRPHAAPATNRFRDEQQGCWALRQQLSPRAVHATVLSDSHQMDVGSSTTPGWFQSPLALTSAAGAAMHAPHTLSHSPCMAHSTAHNMHTVRSRHRVCATAASGTLAAIYGDAGNGARLAGVPAPEIQPPNHQEGEPAPQMQAPSRQTQTSEASTTQQSQAPSQQAAVSAQQSQASNHPAQASDVSTAQQIQEVTASRVADAAQAQQPSNNPSAPHVPAMASATQAPIPEDSSAVASAAQPQGPGSNSSSDVASAAQPQGPGSNSSSDVASAAQPQGPGSNSSSDVASAAQPQGPGSSSSSSSVVASATQGTAVAATPSEGACAEANGNGTRSHATDTTSAAPGSAITDVQGTQHDVQGSGQDVQDPARGSQAPGHDVHDPTSDVQGSGHDVQGTQHDVQGSSRPDVQGSGVSSSGEDDEEEDLSDAEDLGDDVDAASLSKAAASLSKAAARKARRTPPSLIPPPTLPQTLDQLSAAFSNGALLVDKPLGWTSFDVCGKLRNTLKFLTIKRVGHAGTLDPQASGLLVVATGAGTKFCDDFMAMEKEYSGVIRLGEATATYDAEGEVIERMEWSHITDEDIQRAAQTFVGDIMQVPPMYSAIKMGGQKLYNLAREGTTIEREPRPVTITSFTVWRGGNDPNHPNHHPGVSTPIPPPPTDGTDGGARDRFPAVSRSETSPPGSTPQDLYFHVACSKGTYVRSLAFDLGHALGTVAHLAALRRESIGGMRVTDAWQLPDLLGQLQAARKEWGPPEVPRPPKQQRRKKGGRDAPPVVAVTPSSGVVVAVTPSSGGGVVAPPSGGEGVSTPVSSLPDATDH